MDYYETLRALRSAIAGIGKDAGTDPTRGMSSAQRRRFSAPNFMTNERVAFKRLAGGALLVEVSLGRFLESYIYGVTVFCVGELAADAEAWDLSLSQCLHSPAEVADKLRTLDEGGRDRLAALAEAAA